MGSREDLGVRIIYANPRRRNVPGSSRLNPEHYRVRTPDCADLENRGQGRLIFHVVVVHRRRNALALLRARDRSDRAKSGERSVDIVRWNLSYPQDDQKQEHRRQLRALKNRFHRPRSKSAQGADSLA